MTVRSTHLKLIGAAGAAALAIGTVATPAVAASQDINYTCNTLGPTSVGIDPGAIPAKMVAGQKSKRTMKMVVHLKAAQVLLAPGQTVSGTITSKGAHNTFPFNMTIPSQTLPTSGPADVKASGPGTIRPLSAGTWTVKAGNIAASLTVSGLGTLPDSCKAPANSSTHFGTITVSKDKSTTKTGAAYKATKHLVKGKAKVKGHFGLAGSGKVKFILKKGTHKVAATKAKLNKKGVAHVQFKHVTKHGKYSVTAKFPGDKALKKSSGKAKFKV